MLAQNIIERIQKADPDRYRASLFAPKPARADILCLYAFHLELAKVPELVSEPMIGAIRYQWWRDVLDEIYGGKPVRAHEITTPLADMIKRKDIPRFWLDQLIDGRERDLDPAPFSDMDAAASYCEQTSGVLLKLAGHICSPDDMPANMDQMGRAWGLTGLARAWPFYEKSMLQALTFDDICGAARQSHAEARKEKISPAYIPICAYIALIPGFLKRLENSPQTEQSDQPIYSPFARRFRLLKTVMTGQI